MTMVPLSSAVLVRCTIVNRGTGYETLELSKAGTMLLQSMLNWP